MKRKSMGVVVSVLMAVFIAGCGSASQAEIQTISSETKESVQTEEQSSASSEASNIEEIEELTFADLSKYSFEFSSGAGAW